MPWAAAIALGAVVAPPDAVAATAVLRPLRPPHRILTILEGESLLNDASALLIYRLAIGAVAAKGFSIAAVAPTFLARLSQLEGVATREAAPEEARGQKVCTTRVIFSSDLKAFRGN